MYTTNIILNTIEEVKKFVELANKYPFDIDLSYGKYTVNGKSIMGIFSLELSKTLVMQAECEETDEFVSALEPFIIKE